METTYFNTDDIKQYIKTCAFISRCSVQQRAAILNEILMLNQILSWGITNKTLISVESVSVNGSAIQLNLEEYEK